MGVWSKFGAAVCMFALALTAGADDKTDKDGPFTDEKFVEKASSGNLQESKLGEVGQLKGQSTQVKEYAKRMVLDHGNAQNELRAAAEAAGLTVPDKMLPEHQKHVDRFEQYKGEAFDADYLKHMVDDHQKAVDLYTRAAKEAKNAQLKGYAEKSLPVIKGHLEMAKKLHEQVKK